MQKLGGSLSIFQQAFDMLAVSSKLDGALLFVT